METYELNVGGGKRRRNSSHPHKELLVSVVAEQRQATPHMQLYEQRMTHV